MPDDELVGQESNLDPNAAPPAVEQPPVAPILDAKQFAAEFAEAMRPKEQVASFESVIDDLDSKYELAVADMNMEEQVRLSREIRKLERQHSSHQLNSAIAGLNAKLAETESRAVVAKYAGDDPEVQEKFQKLFTKYSGSAQQVEGDPELQEVFKAAASHWKSQKSGGRAPSTPGSQMLISPDSSTGPWTEDDVQSVMLGFKCDRKTAIASLRKVTA